MPSTRGYQETLQDDETDEGLLGGLKRYGEKSVESLGRGARKLRKKISLIDKLSDPTKRKDTALESAKFVAESTLPGSGLVTGSQTARSGWEKVKQGDYKGGVPEWLVGNLDMALDAVPGTSALPSLGMFLGVGAKNAPLDKLDDAMDRLKGDRKDLFSAEKGFDVHERYSQDPGDVLRDTGWMVSPVDGQPRFEIDDRPMKMKYSVDDPDQLHLPEIPDERVRNPYARSQSSLGLGKGEYHLQNPPAKIGDLIDHPELFENYPDLAKIPLRAEWADTTTGSYQKAMTWMGYDVPEGIVLRGDNANSLKSVGIHELQHAIQRREGWGSGGSSDMFNFNDKRSREHLKDLDSALYIRSTADQLGITDFSDFGNVGRIITHLQDQGVTDREAITRGFQTLRALKEPPMEELLQRANLIDQVRANGPKTSYAKVSGEVEARNAQKRMHLTPEERTGHINAEFEDGLRVSDTFYGEMLGTPERGVAPYAKNDDTLPWRTQDVPYNAQILRKDGHIPARIMENRENSKDWLLERSEDIPDDDIPNMGHNGGPPLDDGRKRNVKGDYVGAPEGINSPAKEQDLIATVEDLIKRAPEGSKDFYSDFSSQIKDHVRDGFQARQYGTAIGDTSPLSTVDKNISKANTAMNQYTLDGQVDLDGYGIGTADQGPRVQAHLDANQMPTGPKTGPFAHNVISEHFPQPEDPKKGVMDTWMGRGAGYPMDEMGGGLKKSNIDYLNNNVMPGAYERTGTDYKTGQAAAWETLRRDAGEPPQEPIGNLFERNRSTTQMAAIPGPSTGAKPELLNAPLRTKERYTDKMFDAIGDNRIAQSLGLSGPTDKGYGPWQGMMEPNRQIGLQTGTKGAAGKGMELDPASAKLGETMRHWYMLVLGQDASGLTSARPIKTAKAADVIGIDTGKRISGRDGYDKVFGFLKREVGDDWGDKVVVQPYGQGFSFKDIGIGNKGLQRVANRYADEVGGSIKLMKDVGNQFDMIDWSKGEYKALLKGTLENPRLRTIFDQHVPELAAAAQKVHSQFAKQFGFETDTVLDKFRTILGKEGIDGVMKAVKAGVLPALAPVMVIALADDAGLMDDGDVTAPADF